MSTRLFALIAVASISLHAPARPLAAQEAPPTGWSATGELSFVLTTGNSSSSSLGLRGTSEYRWPEASVQLAAGGLRAESGTTTRTATGTPEDFRIVERTDEKLTAENYYVRGRYDRALSATVYALGSAGWERNTFAGIDNRYVLSAGVGNTWFDREETRLKTDLAVTYTAQDDVVEDPAADDRFAGLRATADYVRRLTGTTRLSSNLIVDESLSETSDLRADWTTSASVAVSASLALKLTYQLLYDNAPALVAVPLGDDTVFTELEKLDSVFTVGLQVTL